MKPGTSRDKTHGEPRVKGTGEMQVVEVEESSGNVFEDLGCSRPQDLLVKAELARRICEIISQRKLTQAKAAELLLLDQPKGSALMRGKLNGFSADRPFKL